MRRGLVTIFPVDGERPIARGQIVMTTRQHAGCEQLVGSVTILQWLGETRSTAVGNRHRLELPDGACLEVTWTAYFPDSCGREILRFVGTWCS